MITIKINSLDRKRTEAVTKVNEYFQSQYLLGSMRREAHARKRKQAQDVIDGVTLEDSHAFVQEAQLRNLTTTEFAKEILSKPVQDDSAELLRQSVLLGIENAQTLEDIDAVLKTYGIGG